MSAHFSANQYEEVFSPQRLQNYQVPAQHKEHPSLRRGRTKILSDDRGHLINKSLRSSSSPWGSFVGTWQMQREPVQLKTRTRLMAQLAKRDRAVTGNTTSQSGMVEELEAQNASNQEGRQSTPLALQTQSEQLTPEDPMSQQSSRPLTASSVAINDSRSGSRKSSRPSSSVASNDNRSGSRKSSRPSSSVASNDSRSGSRKSSRPSSSVASNAGSRGSRPASSIPTIKSSASSNTSRVSSARLSQSQVCSPTGSAQEVLASQPRSPSVQSLSLPPLSPASTHTMSANSSPVSRPESRMGQVGTQSPLCSQPVSSQTAASTSMAAVTAGTREQQPAVVVTSTE